MIYGNIHTNETPAAPAISRALELLRGTDVAAMGQGQYPLDGDRVILQVVEATTGPRETKRPEIHKKYIDVQYMVEGRELIGFYPDHRDGAVLEDHLEDRDVLFYAEREDVNEVMLPMTRGQYAVFFPEDVHRPCCMMGAPENIKKAVLKLRVDSL